MRTGLLSASVLLASVGVAVVVSAQGKPKRALAPAPDLRALIACEKGMRDWMTLASNYNDAEARASWGWREAKLGTGMMTSFALSKPIAVFGQQTSQIAFSGSGVVAVLKDKKLDEVVRALHLEPTYDGVNTKIFAREVRSDAAQADARPTSKISLTAATSTDYPGVVLAGCSYEVIVE